jgi:hypothetical protein
MAACGKRALGLRRKNGAVCVHAAEAGMERRESWGLVVDSISRKAPRLSAESTTGFHRAEKTERGALFFLELKSRGDHCG